jgi:uncharacterized Zn finger protein (UPF0148 family)
MCVYGTNCVECGLPIIWDRKSGEALLCPGCLIEVLEAGGG